MAGVAQSLAREIGRGSLGRVYLGKWRETEVAIKMLEAAPSRKGHPASLKDTNTQAKALHSSLAREVPSRPTPCCVLPPARYVNLESKIPRPALDCPLPSSLRTSSHVGDSSLRAEVRGQRAKLRKLPRMAPPEYSDDVIIGLTKQRQRSNDGNGRAFPLGQMGAGADLWRQQLNAHHRDILDLQTGGGSCARGALVVMELRRLMILVMYPYL